MTTSLLKFPVENHKVFIFKSVLAFDLTLGDREKDGPESNSFWKIVHAIELFSDIQIVTHAGMGIPMFLKPP